jgi:HTH-type transcriptional regulator / antitoxin HigA
MTGMTKQLQVHWTALRPILAIRDEDEYDRAIERMNQLVDEIGINEAHPLYELLDTLGTLIHAYEEQHEPLQESSGIEALQYLMEEHGLTQSELPEVGSQGVISEILNGKRELNVRQIRALSLRFGVAPAVFF